MSEPASGVLPVLSRRERLRVQLRRWRGLIVIAVGVLVLVTANWYGPLEDRHPAAVTLVYMWCFWMLLALLVAVSIEISRPIPVERMLDRHAAKVQLFALLAPSLSLLAASTFDGQTAADPLSWSRLTFFLYVVALHLLIVAALALGGYVVLRTRGRRRDLVWLWLPPLLLLSPVGIQLSPWHHLFSTRVEINEVFGFFVAVATTMAIVGYRTIWPYRPTMVAAPTVETPAPTFRSYFDRSRIDPPR